MGEREYLKAQFEERTLTRPIDKVVSEIATLKRSIDILKLKQMEVLSKLDLLIVAQNELNKAEKETVAPQSSGGWIFS
jgi:hypothetical protein